jgi:hypothetical protein
MFKTLRRDIFQLKIPEFPIKKVIPPTPNPLSAAKYACVYWVDYLHYSGCHKRHDLSVDERGCVGDFLHSIFVTRSGQHSKSYNRDLVNFDPNHPEPDHQLHKLGRPGFAASPS